MLRTSLMLDEEKISFLEGGCALIVCTLDADGEPFASRAWGLTVVSREQARVRLLAMLDVLPRGAVAITGTDVPTLRSLQLKGQIVAVEHSNEADVAKAKQYTDAFYADVERTDNVPRELLNRMTPTEFLACTVQVEELYDQTPGPRAGCALS
jgi:hypothetical protein